MEDVLFHQRLFNAITESDVPDMERFLRQHPEYLSAFTPFAWGTWLHYAAGAGNVDVLTSLVALGMDVNRGAKDDGRLPLKDAAWYGKLENARYLISQGSRIDTSTSARNPLFGAIVGGSHEVVELLLASGIDPTVRYTTDPMKNLDAVAFALWRNERELARLIASNVAGGDVGRREALLSEAEQFATAQEALTPMRPLPKWDDRRFRIPYRARPVRTFLEMQAAFVATTLAFAGGAVLTWAARSGHWGYLQSPVAWLDAVLFVGPIGWLLGTVIMAPHAWHLRSWYWAVVPIPSAIAWLVLWWWSSAQG